MPFAGLVETAFASNCPASAANITAAADEFEIEPAFQIPHVWHGAPEDADLLPSPVDDKTCAHKLPAATDRPLIGYFCAWRYSHIAAMPRSVTLREPIPGQKQPD